MKTAIIIIPSLSQGINPESYLSVCSEKVRDSGYTLLHSASWCDYRSIDMKELITRLSDAIDSFYFFVDFGVNSLMTDLIREYSRRNQFTRSFKKEIKIEISHDINQINLAGILTVLSKKANIPVDILKMKTRKREIVEVRQLYFCRAKECTKSSLKSIGMMVGVDHATVLHGIKHVNDVKDLSARYNEYFGCSPVKGKVLSPGKVETKKDIKPVEPVSNAISHQFVSPFVSPYAGMVSCNNREMHGYREHSL